jgi:hypothetical protein
MRRPLGAPAGSGAEQGNDVLTIVCLVESGGRPPFSCDIVCAASRARLRPQGPGALCAPRSSTLASSSHGRAGLTRSCCARVTRMVGVVPNAAYRHFDDRDALLAAVRDEAVRRLAQRMADGMSQVRAGAHTPTGATPAPSRREGVPRVRPQRAGPLRHRIRGSRPPARGHKR